MAILGAARDELRRQGLQGQARPPGGSGVIGGISQILHQQGIQPTQTSPGGIPGLALQALNQQSPQAIQQGSALNTNQFSMPVQTAAPSQFGVQQQPGQQGLLGGPQQGGIDPTSVMQLLQSDPQLMQLIMSRLGGQS